MGTHELTAAWSISSPQRLPVTGGADYPSVRYSASSVMYNGEMIITHGYFYDHGNHHPAWQSNAWAFNIKQQAWRKIHEGERAGSPSARYCSSAVLFEHGLWMFGGDDGGHKTSVRSARQPTHPSHPSSQSVVRVPCLCASHRPRDLADEQLHLQRPLRRALAPRPAQLPVAQGGAPQWTEAAQARAALGSRDPGVRSALKLPAHRGLGWDWDRGWGWGWAGLS